MTASVTILDGKSKKILRTEELNHSGSAIVFPQTFGSADKGIPRDMGAVIATYIYRNGKTLKIPQPSELKEN